MQKDTILSKLEIEKFTLLPTSGVSRIHQNLAKSCADARQLIYLYGAKHSPPVLVLGCPFGVTPPETHIRAKLSILAPLSWIFRMNSIENVKFRVAENWIYI